MPPRLPADESFVDGFEEERGPQRIVFGWGRAADLASEVDLLSAGRVLLVSERSTSAIAEDVQDRLGSRVVGCIPRVRPHVPRANVDSAADLVRSTDADLVVTIGGGSATGLGKALALETSVRLIAVPTTYAGSEVTAVYGTTHGGRKHTGSDDRVLPRTVVYDPELSVSLPARVTASSGMNAIAHCVEGLYAENSAKSVDEMADQGIRVLVDSLPSCVAKPDDRTGRGGALYGSYLAGGVVASAGMALHHRICHVLGGTFGLAHGDANAVVLPHVVAFNQPFAEQAIARIAAAMGTHDAALALFQFAGSMGAPTSLRELGMQATDFERAADLTLERNGFNPRPVTRDAVLSILHAAFEGNEPHEYLEEE